MTIVIKKSGQEQEFDWVKLKKSIEKAAIDADSPVKEEAVNSVAKRVEKKITNQEFVESSAIRTAILNELEIVEKPTAKAWRAFDRKYKALAQVEG